MIIKTQSPTRVDFSGGTLDCWPLFLLVDSCVTINLSVSIFTRVTLEERQDKKVHVDIRDLKFVRTFDDVDALLAAKDAELSLVQRHVAHWRPSKGFNLTTESESPVGGGLGGSSSLSISLIKAFSQWLERPLNVPESVTLASNLEAQVLHKMTGTQDYFPALKPGLNAIHYTPMGARLETLSAPSLHCRERLSLVYTGQPHHSGLNNWQVIKAALNSEAETMQALRDIRDISADLYQALKGDRWDQLPELFQREFAARVRLSAGFSSPEIERLRDVALKAGSQAVKICGAGGGGCVFLWSQPDVKARVEDACRSAGFRVLNCEPVLS